MKAILVPGWNVRNPDASVGMLRPYLEDVGFGSVEVRGYGYLIWPWSTRRRTELAAEALCNDLNPGDTLIAHSNAAVLSRRLSWLPGCPPHRALWLNPALDREAEPGPALELVHVFYSRSDWPVRLARYLPGSRWGDMGARGPAPFHGWDEEPRLRSEEWKGGHSAYRLPENAELVALTALGLAVETVD